MTIARSAVFWVFACSLPLLLIATTLTVEATSTKLYEYGINKYGINQATGIDKPELARVYQHLATYFNFKAESAQIEVSMQGRMVDLFNERELIHLQDVRSLVQMGYWIQRVSFFLIVSCALVLFFGLKAGWRTLIKGLTYGSAITLGLMAFVLLWALIGFDRLFILFHEVSFSNDYWILDPSRDYLIMLTPGGFLYDATLLAFGAVITQALLIGGISFGVLRGLGWDK